MTCSTHEAHHDWFTRELTLLTPSLERRAHGLCHCRSRAEDLVQDTLERALRYREKFEPGTNLRAWLHQILFNLFVSSHRRRQRERQTLERYAEEAMNTWRHEPEPAMTASLPVLERALGALPERLATVVRLVDLDELSYREAATQLSVPIGTVMSRLCRARRRLQQVVEPTTVPIAAAEAA
jgi:RNA polymerase sigma-70 factor, ECF subfamily